MAPVYRARMFGEFSNRAQDTVLTPAHIEHAICRGRDGAEEEDDTEAPTVLAVDMPLFDSDKSVLLLASPSAVVCIAGAQPFFLRDRRSLFLLPTG